MSDLPTGWETLDMGDACDIVRGITFPASAKQDIYENSNVCCLRTTNIQAEIEWQDVYFVSYDYVKREDQFIAVGDILMSMANSYELVGKVAVVREKPAYPTVFGAFLSAIRPKLGVERKYLFYLLRSSKIQAQLRQGSSQTVNIANISVKTLSTIQIPLPPLNEQRRIVAKLDSLFARSRAARQELEHIPQLIRRCKQAVLEAAISGDFMSDWQQINIQSIAQVGTGSTPLKSNPDYYTGGKIPWVTSASTGQSFVTSASEFVTDAAVRDNRLKKYPVGTLLVAMYGEGKTRGQVTELKIEATINQACAAIVVNESVALKEYVKLSLQANYLQMRELAEGGNQPNLNLSKIKNFPILIPSIEEQKEIVNRVEKLFKSIEVIEQNYQKAVKLLERLEQATLAKAFRGELVPQDPKDEPASVLLERIQAQRQEKPKRQSRRLKK